MEDKLNEHEKRITELEKNSIRFEDRMNNILEKLDNLINNYYRNFMLQILISIC